MAETAKKTPAKKAPAKKTAAPKADPPQEKSAAPTESKKEDTSSDRTPHVGEIVLFQISSTVNNGASVAPAVITRVWYDDLVNLRVLLDGPDVMWATSVTLLDEAPGEPDPDEPNDADDPDEARRAANVAIGRVCYWPEWSN